MTGENPWVRIVIVNYNAGAMLQACVDALASQTMPDFETVIVDNASTVHPISGLRLPDDRFHIRHAGDNIGFAAATNLGAQGQHGALDCHAQPRHEAKARLACGASLRDRAI